MKWVTYIYFWDELIDLFTWMERRGWVANPGEGYLQQQQTLGAGFSEPPFLPLPPGLEVEGMGRVIKPSQ